jgi:7-cyano-7-deazaguanine synthase
MNPVRNFVSPVRKKGISNGVKKAVVLLSGGLDSTITLYLAKRNYDCLCLIFEYGQRHKREVESAKRIARIANCPSQVIRIKLPWKGSSLLDKKFKIPQLKNSRTQELKNSIPSTYVPARNTIFLSFAVSFAEAIGAEVIFIGANSIDYSGYPDCRPEYYHAFKKVVRLGTKAGIEGNGIKILTPMIKRTKAQIIKLGLRLGAPLELTWSCYRGGRKPCGMCDSCLLRAKGFKEARIKNPLLVTTGSQR